MRSLPGPSADAKGYFVPIVGAVSFALGAGMYVVPVRGEGEWASMLIKVALLLVVPMFAFSCAARQEPGMSAASWWKRIGYLTVAFLALLVASVR
jgi:hypothetical protein